MEELLGHLYTTLDRRIRPEDLLNDLIRLAGWSASQEQVLRKVALRAAAHNPWGWSSRSQDFWRPVSMERQVRKAAELFPAVELPLNVANDPVAAQPYIGQLWNQLGITTPAPGQAEPDFLHDRLNRAGRQRAGVELSNHAYNKRFRLAQRLSRKRDRFQQQLRQRTLLLASKSRLASQLSSEEFGRDPSAAMFVAYYTASANRRSIFSAWGQERARDEVADVLLERCRHSRTCNWYAVAHVYPTPEVLSHLTDRHKGQLLGQVSALLYETADLLGQLWSNSTFRRESMVVKRGDDSSTWNLLAGAWNQLRDQWINLVYSLSAQSMLDEQLPGKAMRLMAADVVFLHQAYGTGGLDPNTAVWTALPLPWEVVAGKAECTRLMIEKACEKVGLNPVKSGWTGPRQEALSRPFTPTPELVHGVEIYHPALAQWLRQRGVFSGKSAK